jgi:hypothetical protein
MYFLDERSAFIDNEDMDVPMLEAMKASAVVKKDGIVGKYITYRRDGGYHIRASTLIGHEDMMSGLKDEDVVDLGAFTVQPGSSVIDFRQGSTIEVRRANAKVSYQAELTNIAAAELLKNAHWSAQVIPKAGRL